MNTKETIRTAHEIAFEIFYSRATNGQAPLSIERGAKLIEDYASQFKQSESKQPEHVRDEARHPKVTAFADAMQNELTANEHKGDWEVWRNVSQMLSEFDHHKEKLLKALVDDKKGSVKEYLADCGNILMFIGNAGGLYDNAQTHPSPLQQPGELRWISKGYPKKDGFYLCEYTSSTMDEGMPNQFQIFEWKKDNDDFIYWDYHVLRWLEEKEDSSPVVGEGNNSYENGQKALAGIEDFFKRPGPSNDLPDTGKEESPLVQLLEFLEKLKSDAIDDCANFLEKDKEVRGMYSGLVMGYGIAIGKIKELLKTNQ